ncbi:MAG TPA: hypothetical protein VEJ88_06895 [Dissulfurispiraceae bacterium]|nr:hypothetical protein [Dissulfurispiraceae bacterium]
MSKKRKQDNKTNKKSIESNSAASSGDTLIHKYPSFVEWAWSALNRAVELKWVLGASVLLLLATVFIYYPSRVDDYDIWYHLKFGEYFIKNHTFNLDHSIFSWTPADPKWRYGIWLGSSMLYIAYSLLGPPGLYVLQWIVLLSIPFFYWRFARLIGNSVSVTHIFCLLLVFLPVNLTAIYIKPELFTTLFFTISVFVFFHVKVTHKQKWLFIYPPLFFLWVNTHGGYLVGLFFLSLAMAGEGLNYFLSKKNRLPAPVLKTLLIMLVASYVAVIFNPYGISYHIGILKSLISPEYMGYATKVFAWASLWGYVIPNAGHSFRFENTVWSLLFTIIVFAVLSVYAFKKRRFYDFALLLLNFVFFYLGMKQARVTIFLPIVALFSFLYVLRQSDLLGLTKKAAPVALVLFVVCSFYIIDQSMMSLEDRSWFGSNMMKYVPVNEVEFIKKNRLPGPIFNDYLIGGYLIWAMYPDYKVFIDPRYGPYWKELGPDYFKFTENLTLENLKSFNTKYPFKIAIIHMREIPLIFLFLSSPDWRLLYFDKTAVVIVNKSVVPLLSKEALSTDIGTHRFRDVDNPLVLSNLFNFYLQVGPQYAEEIKDIFEKNVSVFFKNKNAKLMEMRNMINAKMQQLQQLQLQQQQKQQQQQAQRPL